MFKIHLLYIFLMVHALLLVNLNNVCDRLANKQDVDGALDEGDICDRLNLETLANQYETPCRVVSIH